MNAYANTADLALRQALSSKNLRYVGTRGNTSSRVCVVGEAPGEKEDAQGLPFVGPSGWLLDKMLGEVGFGRQEVWFTNPYKTRPPDNIIKRLHELGVPHNLFHEQFFEEMRNFKPTIIIACGKTATNLLVPETKPRVFKGKNQDDKEGFGSWRGSLLISPFLDWPHYVIPMYHTAYVLKNYAEREICVLVLSRAKEEYESFRAIGKLTPLPTYQIITQPPYNIASDFLELCLDSQLPISVDIELLKRKVPYTISFAPSPDTAMSMSFWNYPETNLVKLWRLMDEIFKRKNILGQNFTTFDAHWLRVIGFSVNIYNVSDTLIRHHVLWPGLRHRLEFQTMQYTRQPYYKEEGKTWSLKDPIDKLMRYNCLDTLVTYEIYNQQEIEFKERAA